MSKVVTYKEAITSYEIVLFDSDNHPKETARKYGLKGGHIELQEFLQFHRANVLEFLAQHRPPTFDEVVKAWEEAYPDSGVIVDYFRDENFFYIYLDKALWKFTAEYPIMSGISVGSYKVINAINLTIRYLENKGEEE